MECWGMGVVSVVGLGWAGWQWQGGEVSNAFSDSLIYSAEETITLKLGAWMTLSPWLGAAGMTILWHIRSPLLPLIFISVAFPSRPLGIGMHFQTLLSPLLKVPRMVLLSSLLWWELGISLLGPGPGKWLSLWCVTNKQFWFWLKMSE